MCCLKNNASKTKHTQFQTKLKICGKLDPKLTKIIAKNMSQKLVWRLYYKKEGVKTFLNEKTLPLFEIKID